ncbi:hypothetical protein ACO0LO_20055 [Undibacterium sp. TJN25]|uniref:hypothetical protein n=1 Tax=Undibacterium sp. TJN25 TaxID=3413056 RepID=UPI003BF29DB5
MSTFALQFTERTNAALRALSFDTAEIIDLTTLEHPRVTFSGSAMLTRPYNDGHKRLAITVLDGLSVSVFLMPSTWSDDDVQTVAPWD